MYKWEKERWEGLAKSSTGSPAGQTKARPLLKSTLPFLFIMFQLLHENAFVSSH